MNIAKIGILAGGLVLASCGGVETVKDRAEAYMQDKPAKEYYEVVDAPYPQSDANYARRNVAYQQSKLDSVAYRDLLNTTPKANEPNVVAEFNLIAAKNRLKTGYDGREMLKETPVTLREYNRINKRAENILFVHESRETTFYQNKVDSIAYDAFFKKHNLLDKEMAKKISDVAKKIAPKVK